MVPPDFWDLPFDLLRWLGNLGRMIDFLVPIQKIKRDMYRLAKLSGLALAVSFLFAAGMAQGQIDLPGAVNKPANPAPERKASPPEPQVPEGSGVLRLQALFGEDGKPVRAGVIWRVFRERAEADSTYKLLRRSTTLSPLMTLPYGNYVVHLAFGLAGVTKRIEISEKIHRAELVLNAGMLRITGMLDSKKIARQRMSVSVYIPSRRNPEAKLIARDVAPGQNIGLPVGTYHIVSTYLDNVRPGRDTEARKTNSVVNTDVRIRSGQVTEAILKHHAAQLTLKLVKAPGGEALANTSFTVLTPGGDVLREMIGAFPSVTLAEGEYVAIARNEGRTFQSTFKVQSGTNRDVEILAK